MGNRLTDTLTARYGLYASKIGAGLDWQAAPGVGFRADLWDTNHPRLDVRGLFGVNSDASIWIGAEGLFRRPVPVIGVQFRH
jgi:phospholipid/cholesterol/gamma-HCH transport system substrate-binding protein